MWGGRMFKTKSLSKSLLIYRLMLKKNGIKYECAFTKHLAPLLSVSLGDECQIQIKTDYFH